MRSTCTNNDVAVGIIIPRWKSADPKSAPPAHCFYRTATQRKATLYLSGTCAAITKDKAMRDARNKIIGAYV